MSGKSLDGRVAFITGGLRGIGRACAERLAAEGAAVVIADLDSEDEANKIIRDHGLRADYIRADVTSETD